MSWQQKLKKQIPGQLSDVKQLRFNNLSLNKLPDEFIQEIAKCQNLEVLSFNQCGIRSLENFITMPSVIHFEYLDNFTTSKTLPQIVKAFPNLQTLIAGGNYLRELKDIDSLKSLLKLENLNIMNGINKPDSEIRKYAFDLIPSLKILDDKNIDGQIPQKPKVEKQVIENEADAQNIEIEEGSQLESDSAECSDDSNQNEESESEEDDDSDLSDFIEKKVKDE